MTDKSPNKCEHCRKINVKWKWDKSYYNVKKGDYIVTLISPTPIKYITMTINIDKQQG